MSSVERHLELDQFARDERALVDACDSVVHAPGIVAGLRAAESLQLLACRASGAFDTVDVLAELLDQRDDQLAAIAGVHALSGVPGSLATAVLNEALLRQRDDRRFCTVAYAYFEKLDRGARVGVACGGHPLPLLLRSDGTVETVGEPGTLLGVVPDPDLEDRAVTLEPGDALVFYTDGVIEGRGDSNVLDERRLAELVATCAGAGADAIAARVEEAAVLSQGGRPRDDVAVLVLRVVD